ncbi:MAG: PIN domain-containing protein [Candidatus Saccharimonas sp.]|nr:PIN domain-containing protein [Planctomycetaceae bacterium]
MRVLVDTNVVLDFLLRREPWMAQSRELLRAQREGKVELFISANSVTDLFYVIHRQVGRHRAWAAIRACLKNLTVVPIGRAELLAAAQLDGSDFEDNLQVVCAVAAQVETITTRDVTGFDFSPIPVMLPADVVSRLAAS